MTNYTHVCPVFRKNSTVLLDCVYFSSENDARTYYESYANKFYTCEDGEEGVVQEPEEIPPSDE